VLDIDTETSEHFLLTQVEQWIHQCVKERTRLILYIPICHSVHLGDLLERLQVFDESSRDLGTYTSDARLC
jgi:hypothetical protein